LAYAAPGQPAAGGPGNAPSSVTASSDHDALQESILSGVIDTSPGVKWGDIAGLEAAKATLNEIVVLPTLRPDIFTGLRAPPRGVLLFGPPGTGKTLLAKAVATESQATFFAMSASSLTSKMFGEGEKLMKALFLVARDRQPSVIFIDEIDSLLASRSSGEHEASRRLKTEFLIQFDGVASAESDRVLVIGATNRPQELDEAARRRMVRRIYIPLPEAETREALLGHLMQSTTHGELAWHELATLTEGYSGSDITSLCKDAAMEPIRELGSRIASVDLDTVRPLEMADFRKASGRVRASVSIDDLHVHEEWNKTYGMAA